MYYAVLGNQSSTIDIYNHKLGSWELITGLDYNFLSTYAAVYRDIIYATGTAKVGRIMQFDPSSLNHKIVNVKKLVYNGNPIMFVYQNKLIIRGVS